MKKIIKNSLATNNAQLVIVDAITKSRLDNVRFIENLNKVKKDTTIDLLVGWTLGDPEDYTRFKLYECKVFKTITHIIISGSDDHVMKRNPDMSLVHPRASITAFELFLAQRKDSKFSISLGTEMDTYSDAVSIYKKKLIGMLDRYPHQFVSSLSQREIDSILKYMLYFCCDYNEHTIVEIAGMDLYRYKVDTMIRGLYNTLDVARLVNPKLQAWDLVRVSYGIFHRKAVRIECIKAILDEFNVTVDGLKTYHVKSFAPTLLNYYRNEYKRNLLEIIKQEYVQSIPGSSSNSNVTHLYK